MTANIAQAAYQGLPPAGTKWNPIRRDFTNERILAMRQESIWANISKFVNYPGCGAVIEIEHELVDNSGIHERLIDQKPKIDDLPLPKTSYICMGKEYYKQHKLDKCLKDNIEKYDKQYLTDLKGNHDANANFAFDAFLYEEMLMNIDLANQGANAGARTQSLNLGTPTAPLALNANTIRAVGTQALRVMPEQNIHRSMGMGRMFMAVPEAFYSVMLASDDFTRADWRGDCIGCELIQGMHHKTFMGYDLVTANCLPTRVHPVTGETVYPLIFGFQDATWSTGSFKVWEEMHDGMDEYSILGFKWCFGANVFDGRKLAVMWVCIDTGEIEVKA